MPTVGFMEPKADARYEDAEKFVYDGGWYENEELRHLERLLPGLRLFVDVGASLGPYTRCANQFMKNGELYAIEANPETYKRLQKLCRDWEAEGSNHIHPIHAAASSEPGKIDFFIPTVKSAHLPLSSSLFQNKAVTDDWEKVTVDCVVLDTLFEGKSPDFIKMDVEGAEYRVLKGAHQILQRGTCRFLVEVHPWGDPTIRKTPVDIFRLFYDYGYDFKRVARHWLFQKAG
jgi:FkbM family methyltransferase